MTGMRLTGTQLKHETLENRGTSSKGPTNTHTHTEVFEDSFKKLNLRYFRVSY